MGQSRHFSRMVQGIFKFARGGLFKKWRGGWGLDLLPSLALLICICNMLVCCLHVLGESIVAIDAR